MDVNLRYFLVWIVVFCVTVFWSWKGMADSVDNPVLFRLDSEASGGVRPHTPITIDTETHSAFSDALIRWDLQIPPDAILELWFGVAPSSANTSSGEAARFKILMETAGLPSRVLFEQTLSAGESGWRHARIPLKNPSEQTTVFRFEKSGGNTYWGNPFVFCEMNEKPLAPVILISCDALRADHLSCYGYRRKTTPNLDQWLSEVVLFENAIVQETWTLPSHRVMLTGLHLKNQRLTYAQKDRESLAEEIETLPEFFAGKGYLTAGFTGHSWWLLPWRGFSQGMDIYSTPVSFRTIEKTEELLFDWIRMHQKNRLFLFFHNYDIHSKTEDAGCKSPYDSGNARFHEFSKAFSEPPSCLRTTPQPFAFSEFLQAYNDGKIQISEEEQSFMEAGYDDSIQYVDHAISDFLNLLKECGLYDSALIILTADHGEEFREHGCFVHKQVYDECARVPLMIKFPKGRFGGKRITPVVQTVDIYPTILDVLGFAGETPKTDGQSLLPIIEEKSRGNNIAYTQRNVWQAVRTDTKKLIRNIETDKYEYYDLTTDPGEKKNIIDSPDADFSALHKELENFFQVQSEGWYLRFVSTAANWDATLLLTAPNPFYIVSFDKRVNAQLAEDGKYKIEVLISITPGANRRTVQEWVIKNDAANMAPIQLSLTSTTPFQTPVGEPVCTANFTLSSEKAPSKPAGEYQPPHNVASFSYWLKSSSGTSESSQGLSDEEVKQLKTLGYLN